MPILDSGIYNALGVKPKSTTDYLNDYNALDRNALALKTGQVDYQNALQAQKDDYAMRDASRSFGADATANYNALLQAGLPKQAQAYYTNSLANQKTQADTQESRSKAKNYDSEVLGRDLGVLKDLTGQVMKTPTKAAALSAIDQFEKLTGRDGSADRAAVNALPEGDTGAVVQWAAGHAIAADKLLPHIQTNNIGGSTVTQAIDPVTMKPTTVSTIANTQSPESIATNATSRANNAATIAGENQRAAAATTKDYTLAGLGPDGKDAGGGTGGLSPAAIENAASRYNLDGTLPPSVGRGNQGARDIRAIQNRAAELSVGTNGTDLRISQLDNKGAAASLTQLQRAQQMSGSFEKTANANADLALSLSQKMDRTGIPMLNAGLQAWKTGTGSPEATQFAAANATFVGEYAKIMSGGMGSGPTSDSARHKAETLLTTAMTPQQYEGNVRLLQKEMQNRMKGFDDQIDQVKTKMRGGSATAAPGGAAPTAALPEGWKIEKVGK